MRSCDLNVPYAPHDQLVTVLNQLLHLGYHVGAVNVSIDCRKGPGEPAVTVDELRAELTAVENELDTSLLRTEGLTYKLWARATYVVESGEQVEAIASGEREKWDICAVAPITVDALRAALDARWNDRSYFDLVSVNVAESFPDWLEDDDALQKLSDSEIPVEICYAGLIDDSSVRSEALSKLRSLCSAYKDGKLKIILSSGTGDKMLLRAPIDVANMMNLWDVPNELAIKCVSGNANDLLIRCLGPGDLGRLYAKPMVELIHALGLRVRRTPHGDGKRRRTKRRKKSA